MRMRESIIARGGLLAGLVLALLAPVLTGCGVGPATNPEKISKTTTTYLEALAEGDAAKACAQLTRRAKGGACVAAMTAHVSRLDSDSLRLAADGSMDIEIHGETATVGFSPPEGARLRLIKVDGVWRIASGYAVG
jgi:hypothetical protein